MTELAQQVFSERLRLSDGRPGRPQFSVDLYLSAIRDELAAFGFESAFVKANTRARLIAART